MIKDMKALKIMQSSLSDSDFRKTVSVASAKDLWDLLKKCNDNGEAKVRRLEKQFEDLMMYEEEPMDFYLDRVMEITERFRVAGIARPDNQVIRKLLTSLSSSYDDVTPVLEGLMNLPDMTLHVLLCLLDMNSSIPGEAMAHMLKDDLKSLRKAKSEQKWCGVCKKYNHNQEDCYFNPRVVNLSGATQFRDQCHQCRERGHYARDCCNTRNLQQALIDEKRNQQPGDFTYDKEMWMLYKTTSNQMTPYKKFFTTLDTTYRTGVVLANGNLNLAEGMGDVKIMMKGVNMIIKNVLFVPGINRNVLSFSQMAKGGYSMEMGRGECTIKDATGKVFAKTMRENRGIALRFQVIEGNLTS